MTALKWAGKSRDLVEGLLAPYGGPAFLAGKDFHGESFEPDTDFALDWFGDWQRPALYNHGLDDTIKTSVVGRLKLAPTDKGVWAQLQLDKAHEYYDEIASLVDQQALGFSSGSVGHLVETDHKTGKIKRWPIIEGSLTPTPANPDAKAYAVKTADAVAHLAVIGTDWDPDPDPKSAAKSEASFDAASATYTLASLIDLLGDEENPEQAARLRVAIDAINTFVTAEVAEIGTPEDIAETEAMSAAFMSLKAVLTPQALHDAAVASGAACKSGETHEPEPAPLLAIAGKSAETVPALDLEAFKAHFSEIAIAAAKELLGS